jgi:ADP-ribose pyrophosphatase
MALPKSKDSSELLLSGRLFSVRRHTLVEPGGVKVTRDLVHHRGSAVILAQLSDRRVLLVRQFRLAAGELLWELPAGSVDPGETVSQAARRELTEETGYRAKSWRKLLEFFPSPGITDEKMTIYLAQNLLPGPPHTEADEKILVRPFALTDALRMIRTGKIIDAKTIDGLLYFARWASPEK